MLESNTLKGYSTHRIHPNGTVPWADSYRADGGYSSAYLESEWYFGVCLTRCRRFALSWNDVVLELDQDALRSRFRLTPYSWYQNHPKAESEEFLITGKAGFTCKEALLECLPKVSDEERFEDAYQHLEDTVRQRKILLSTGYKGEVKNLNRYVRSVTLVETEAFKKKGLPLTKEAYASHLSWKNEKHRLNRPVIQAWCERNGISFSHL